MNSKQWQELTIVEQIQIVGKIVHLVQTSPASLKMAQTAIEAAEIAGKFDRVKINQGTLLEEFENY